MQLRITALPYIMDEFDRDHDIFQIVGQPVWDDDPTYYEYTSVMAYRSHGPTFPVHPGNSIIYEHVVGTRKTYGGKIAVCIGNMNAEPYLTVEALGNDVRLAVAAGAHSVRLFQGASWIYGFGGPAYGFSGLESLLLELRNGGEAIWYPDMEWERFVFSQIKRDAILDLSKPWL